MKLACLNREMVVEWPENRVPVLLVESPRMFRWVVERMLKQADGEKGPFVLSEDNQPLDFSKHCEVAETLAVVELNDRAAHAALGKWLKKIAVSETYYLATQQICQQLLSWVSDLAMECEEPLVFTRELDWSQIIKVCDLQFEGEEDDLPQKLLRRMRIAQSFLHKDCFILIHAKQYLSQEELNMLYQEAFYRKIRILLLENLCLHLDSDYETAWIVDRDDCEIYPDEV